MDEKQDDLHLVWFTDRDRYTAPVGNDLYGDDFSAYGQGCCSADG